VYTHTHTKVTFVFCWASYFVGEVSSRRLYVS